MFNQDRSVIHAKNPARHCKIIFAGFVLLATVCSFCYSTKTYAATCPDLKVIYARGSGAPRYNNADYQTFKTALEDRLKNSPLTYVFDDLDYPAVGITGDNLSVAIGAFISGGEAYRFGDSVKQGINKLSSIVNSGTCSNTKYVVAGYSQGAMVVSSSLNQLNPNKLVYAATFGDPKIYLPEGAGPVPTACSGKGLSEYRVYVPDCRAHEGLLGAKKPYSSANYFGKVGVWCNKFDIFCSSHYSISSHTSYDTDNVYASAARFIYGKIAAAFNFKNQDTSLHDVAILINSATTMRNAMPDYQPAAFEIAARTLANGGRVAIYSYNGASAIIRPIEKCNFSTCHPENIKIILDEINNDISTQNSNPLLSSSLYVMQQLSWRFGATKSLVIFTGDAYQSPDLGGTKFYDVQKLSKQIDPVNFYIATNSENRNAYQTLATATEGAVAVTTDEINNLPDHILGRYDSLPRVEEEYADEVYDNTIPSLRLEKVENISNSEVSISFSTTGNKTMVALNDMVLGFTDHTRLNLTGLQCDSENTITLVPLTDHRRGSPITIRLDLSTSNDTAKIVDTTIGAAKPSSSNLPKIPKAPNTGRPRVITQILLSRCVSDILLHRLCF